MDYSIDLETLGTQPSTKILSIAVVEFDSTNKVFDFNSYKYIRLGVESQRERTFSQSTIEWWSRQDDSVRQEAFGGSVSLGVALDVLRDFIPTNGVVWGNGSTFDVSILEHAFEYNTPWKFYNVRDMRTIVWAAGLVGFDKENIEFKGSKHNALDDAIHQAHVITTSVDYIRRCRSLV